ncbi:hypothetical protein Tco_1561950 [Tanacetum coccineum]
MNLNSTISFLVCANSASKLVTLFEKLGIGAGSSAVGVVSVMGGGEVEGALTGVCLGDKDGEDVILEGDVSGAMIMEENKGHSII